MLDRLDRLNNLLKPELLKKASDEDDFNFDIPMYEGPPSNAKPISNAKPPLVEEESEDNGDWDFGFEDDKPQVTPKITPVVQSQVPAPVAAPIQKEKPVPAPKAFPSWVDPNWKPIPKFNNIQKKFDTSHWGKLDPFEDDEPKEEKELVQSLDFEPDEFGFESTEQNTGMSIDDAQKYLESLPEDERISKALISLDMADEETKAHPKNKKLAANVLALLSAHFMGLIDNADEIFGEDKEKGIAAAKVFLNSFNEKIKLLPKKLIESTQSEIGKLTGNVQRKLKPLTSQFYGPELIFINNRAIKLMRLNGVSVDDAEQDAQNEWIALKQLAEGLISDDISKQNELLKKGAQSMLASGDFQQAKKEMVIYSEPIKNDIIENKDYSSYLSSLFNINVDVNDDYDELARDFANGDFLETQTKEDVNNFNSIPEQDRDELIQLIKKYGKQALNYYKLEKIIRENAGKNLEEEERAGEVLQSVFDKIKNLSTNIFLLYNKYIKEGFQTFKELYIVEKIIEYSASEQGLESISLGESASEGLSVIAPGAKRDPNMNPRLKRNNETNEAYAARQAHEKELADASRYRYLKRIIMRGDAKGYRDRKKQYQLGQRPKESTQEYRERTKKENELDRIRGSEYKNNKNELVKWRKLATTTKEDRNKLYNQAKKLIEDQKSRTYDLLSRISESWFSKEKLEKIEKELMDNRLQSFQKEYNLIKNYDGMNKDILNLFEFVITQIPKYFKDSKDQIHSEKISSARITFNMASSFMKCAQLQN